ncbi:MAG: FKBP-type peptidyl-prolyl cis-trans isomerase [Cytophagales bacterium]|nr:FKBP-type peptidyl-prolyl cis-trans isomerase [Cytophagales bacterium]
MRFRKFEVRGWFYLAAIGTCILLQSCLNGDEDFYDFNAILVEDVGTIKAHLSANGIDAEMDSTGVFYDINRYGSGYKVVLNADLEVHFRGSTLDGVEFINTFDGASQTVSLGQGNSMTEVTSGLLIGLLGRNEGDSVTIYSPSPWGFQDDAYKNVPPNSILVYNVKIIEIKTLEEDLDDIDEYIANNNWTASVEENYGIRYVVHKNGDQNVTADFGDNVTVAYQGELLDGTVFDTGNLQTELGNGSLIVGFEAGVSQLHLEDSATILIPSVYAYGKAGSGSAIQPNTPILFGIDVLKVTK